MRPGVGTLPDNQRAWYDDPNRNSARFLNSKPHQADCLLGDGFDGIGDGCESDPEQRPCADVIESADFDFVGDMHAASQQLDDQAISDVIMVADNAVEPILQDTISQMPCHAFAWLLVGQPDDVARHLLLPPSQRAGMQHAEITGDAIVVSAGWRCNDEGDASAAHRHEVPCRFGGTADIIKADEVEFAGGVLATQFTFDEYDGQTNCPASSQKDTLRIRLSITGP